LYRFDQEGCVNVHFRSGWEVKPWDLKFYNELFDLRMILEKEAVKRLCEMDHETSEELQALKRIWLVPVEEYKQESKQLIFVLPEYRRQGITLNLKKLEE
jgi:DNA-binding GntR family transcriptional regulator